MSAEAMIDRYTAAEARVEGAVVSRLAALWRAQPGYRDADLERIVSQIVPLVRAGQVTTATLTATYLADLRSDVLGGPAAPRPLASDEITGLRGVPDEEVYARPVSAVWTALAGKAEFPAAVAAGAVRLSQLVSDDLGMARRRAAQLVLLDDDRVVGYRRVIRPELSRGGTCGLCIAASDRTYRVAELLPIHTRCGCKVAPVFSGARGERDPGRTVNGADISALYASMPGPQRKELASARAAVHEHGELGPVLTRAGDAFTGPADIAA